MYVFNENNWLHNGVNTEWNLIYVKENTPIPDIEMLSIIVLTPGVWICAANFPWRFATYFGNDFKKAIKKVKAINKEKNNETKN